MSNSETKPQARPRNAAQRAAEDDVMEPSLKYCTVREGDDEWHLECRFSDGQKYAAILVDGECPRLAERVASLLNGNTWTDERPTEPGEYWLSLCPDNRRPGADVERVTISIVERRQVAQTCKPGWTCIDSGPPRQSLYVVNFDDDLFTNYFDLRASAFDGAKWSRRETPTGFPRNLRAARLSLTLTQSDLAASVGVTKQTVSGWECGATVPPMRTILDLCRALNLTLDQLTKETP